MIQDEVFPRILAVAVIVLDEVGNILLKPRPKEPDKGKWEFVAGYVEPGERLEEAAQRILLKKVNIGNVDSIEFTGKYYDDPNRHPGTNCIPLVFIARTRRARAVIPKEAKWFSPREVSQLKMALDNKEILQDLGLVK